MILNMIWFYYILLINFVVLSLTDASDGDRSVFYQKCVINGKAKNCTEEGENYREDVFNQLDPYTKLLWNCLDNCKYNCMWKTVQGFKDQGYSIPKFHGKWPFTRIFGVQEPASAFASLLNLLSHLYMQTKLYQEIPVRRMPVVLLWHMFAGIMINGWIWSTVFHTRDTPFTEFMDYSCALLMVKALYVAGIIRVFHRSRKFTAIILLPSIPFYATHVVYLYSGNIDYQYNMIANGIFAAVAIFMWLVWGNLHYIAGHHYAWRILAFTFVSAVSMFFELVDFRPKWGWDAHALWHLSTACLPLFFYRFVIDDLNFLQKNEINLSMYSETAGSGKYHKIR